MELFSIRIQRTFQLVSTINEVIRTVKGQISQQIDNELRRK